MYIAIGIIFGFLFTGLLIIHYLDYREEQRNQKNLKKTLKNLVQEQVLCLMIE